MKYVIPVLIFVLAVFLRFYNLASIPNGLQQDETSIGYNAYSVALTGKDEYGIKTPLYFKAFGEYKLPGIIYGSVIPIKIFGLTPFGVRFFSALTGALTIPVIYWFILNLFHKDSKNVKEAPTTLASIGALFLALNPWHIHFSRGAFEVTPALFFLTLGATLFLWGVQKEKTFYAVLGILSLMISVYTYNITRVLAPVLLVYLIASNAGKFTFKKFFLPVFITSVVALLPFIFSISSSGGLNAARGTLIFSSAVVQAGLLEFRSYVISLPPIFTKLFFNMWFLTLWQYIQNLAKYVSVEFFFLSGPTHGNHGIGNNGLFYLFDLPLIIAGIVYLYRIKIRQAKLLITWIIATMAIASLTREVPQATRSFFLIVPLVILSSCGFVWFARKTRELKRALRLATIGGFFFSVVFMLSWYFTSYYVRFPVAYAKSWRSEDKSVSEFISSHKDEYDRILIDSGSGFMYTSYLFYSGFPPDLFQSTVIRSPDDNEGFSRVLSFGNVQIRDIDWAADFAKPRTLIITTPDRKPVHIPPLETFYYPRRPVVFAVKQEIVSYPLEEIAYVAVKTY